MKKRILSLLLALLTALALSVPVIATEGETPPTEISVPEEIVCDGESAATASETDAVTSDDADGAPAVTESSPAEEPAPEAAQPETEPLADGERSEEALDTDVPAEPDGVGEAAPAAEAAPALYTVHLAVNDPAMGHVKEQGDAKFATDTEKTYTEPGHHTFVSGRNVGGYGLKYWDDGNGNILRMNEADESCTVYVDGDMTVRAVFGKKYRVVFDYRAQVPLELLSIGVDTPRSSITKNVVEGRTVAPPTDYDDIRGFTFLGWYDEAGEPFDFSTPIAGVTYLYARYENDGTMYGHYTPPETVTVRFDMDGHGIAPEPQTIPYEGTATQPEDPTAEGWRFLGWTDDLDGPFTYDFGTHVFEDLTLHARWEKLENDGPAADTSGGGGSPAGGEENAQPGGEEPSRPTEPQTYDVRQGAESSWASGSDSGLEFVIKRAENDETTFSHFVGVEIDGVMLDPEDYTAVAGSVVVDIKASYLETLSGGSHSIRFIFDDDTVDAAFRIDGVPENGASADEEGAADGDTSRPGSAAGPIAQRNAESGGDAAKRVVEPPRTGDDAPLALSIALCAGSLLGLAVLTVTSKRKCQ